MIRQVSGAPELARRMARRASTPSCAPLHASFAEGVLSSMGGCGDSPFYVLDLQRIGRRVDASVEAFARVRDDVAIRLAYSVKTNPHTALMRLMCERGLMAECISWEECALAVDAGFHPRDVIFNGRAKSYAKADDFAGILFCDSLTELERVRRGPIDPEGRIGIRLRAVQYGSSFGLDLSAEGVEAAVCDALRDIRSAQLGISFHIAPGAIGHEGWQRCAEGLIEILGRLPADIAGRVRFLDLGGGWYPGDWPDTALSVISCALQSLPAAFRHIDTVLLEPGRALVQDNAVYVTRVVEIREREKEVVVDGSTLDLPDLWSHPHRRGWLVHGTFAPEARDDEDGFVVLGRTCMESDVIARNASLPEGIREGDLYLVGDCGAYDMSMGHNFGRGSLSGRKVVCA